MLPPSAPKVIPFRAKARPNISRPTIILDGKAAVKDRSLLALTETWESPTFVIKFREVFSDRYWTHVTAMMKRSINPSIIIYDVDPRQIVQFMANSLPLVEHFSLTLRHIPMGLQQNGHWAQNMGSEHKDYSKDFSLNSRTIYRSFLVEGFGNPRYIFKYTDYNQLKLFKTIKHSKLLNCLKISLGFVHHTQEQRFIGLDSLLSINLNNIVISLDIGILTKPTAYRIFRLIDAENENFPSPQRRWKKLSSLEVGRKYYDLMLFQGRILSVKSKRRKHN